MPWPEMGNKFEEISGWVSKLRKMLRGVVGILEISCVKLSQDNVKVGRETCNIDGYDNHVPSER